VGAHQGVDGVDGCLPDPYGAAGALGLVDDQPAEAGTTWSGM
jgi:hypothetical protein